MPSSMPRPGAQDRDDQRLRLGQAHAVGRADRCGDGHIGDPYVTGRLVGEQRDEFVGEAAKCWGIGGLVAKRGQLVSDEGVIGDQGSHIGSR